MVQGVGFRFTAERVARHLNLTGWVKNLSDGRVEAICEGEEDQLKSLLDKIKSSPLKSYIQNATVNWSEATGEFKDFEIKIW